MVSQVLVAIAETSFFGRLGTEALAGFALLFTLLAWTVAPPLFRLLGGHGPALANAETYAHILFTGLIAMWANYILAALLRGCGDAMPPGRCMMLASLTQIPLSGILALGSSPTASARG